MTNEEAIKLLHPNTSREAIAELEYYNGFNKNKTIDTINEAIELVCEAAEKQIPKKVEWAIDRSWGKEKKQPVCPVCDYYLIETHFIGDGEKITYCDTCGQKIDWSDAE